jgi:hypothetical protein
MNAGDIEKLAKMSAKVAVSETFLTLGTVISQSDFRSTPIRVPVKSPLRRAPRPQRYYAARSLAVASMRFGRASRPAPRRAFGVY